VALPAAPNVGGLVLSLPGHRLKQMLQQKQELRQLIEEYLEPNIDFGVIPGTGKPTLLKAGAEKCITAFDCFPRFEIMQSEIDHERRVEWSKSYKAKNGRPATTDTGESIGLYRYVVRCQIVHRPTGAVIAEGVGACSSMESKYVRAPREAENTVLKISKKRAMVDATLSAFGLSERFTQDIEDLGPAASDDGHTAAPDPVPEELTLDAANALAFPWPNVKEYSGKTLGDLPTKMISRILNWCEKKVAEGDAGPKIRQYAEATALILSNRPEEPAEGTADPAQQDLLAGAGAPAAPAAPEDTTLKPGKVEDALAQAGANVRAAAADEDDGLPF
jgi:hypothetical protein